MSKTAFVTGGTGFIGSHLVEELLRRGYGEVRCLVRDRLKWLKGLDVTVVRGGLGDIEALWKGLDGVDYVYHVAGVTRAEDWATFEGANVRATLNLLGAVRTAAPDVEKVLVTSSLAAVGACEAPPADEAAPLRPISRYGRSKALMEQALAAPVQDGTVYLTDLPTVIVRPPAVYGPREADIFEFFKTVSKGVFPVVGSGRERELSLVHVRDLVRGMVDACENPDTTGETFFLGSPHAYAWQEVKEATEAALGSTAVRIPVPRVLVKPVGAIVETLGKLTGQYPPLNREKAREIREGCLMCSSEKAARVFGYAPEVPLEVGIAETIAWYRAAGWL